MAETGDRTGKERRLTTTPLDEPSRRIAGGAVFPPLHHDWSVEEVLEILQRPLIELVFEAQAVHQRHHGEGTVQREFLIARMESTSGR